MARWGSKARGNCFFFFLVVFCSRNTKKKKDATMSCPSGGRLSTSSRSIWAFCTACMLVLMVPIRACWAELYVSKKKKKKKSNYKKM